MDVDALTGGMLIGRVRGSTTAQIVSDKLAFMIASGLLSVGDALPSERDLSRMLGISRITARSAIQNLAARGLVEIAQGARTRVLCQNVEGAEPEMTFSISLAAHDLNSVYAARRIVEREILREVARTVDGATLARLADLVAAQADMLEDVVAFQIADREFHETIYRAGGNPVLSEFALGLYAYGLGFRRKALSMEGAIERSYHDHLRIVEALNARDEDGAARRADEHLQNILDTTSDAMRRPPAKE